VIFGFNQPLQQSVTTTVPMLFCLMSTEISLPQAKQKLPLNRCDVRAECDVRSGPFYLLAV